MKKKNFVTYKSLRDNAKRKTIQKLQEIKEQTGTSRLTSSDTSSISLRSAFFNVVPVTEESPISPKKKDFAKAQELPMPFLDLLKPHQVLNE